MTITDHQVAAMKRQLFGRPRGPTDPNAADFTIRPISVVWRANDRRPAFRSAVCNAAYIARDSTPRDRYGPMPSSFGQRRHELVAHGLALPKSAPKWASMPYRIWEEADTQVETLNDMTEVVAWHVLMQIPATIPSSQWRALVVGFVERELVARGGGRSMGDPCGSGSGG